jgi:uncharacterized membrane protein
MNHKNIFFILVLITLMFSGCRGGKHAPMTDPNTSDFLGNTQGNNSQKQGASYAGPTYVKDIKPIFEKNCVPCHAQGSAYGSWLDYKIVFAKRALIKTRVFEKKDMPVGKNLPDSSRALIAKWIDNGAIESVDENPNSDPSKIEPQPESPLVGDSGTVSPPQTNPTLNEPPTTPVITPTPETPTLDNGNTIEIDYSKITYIEHIKPLFEKYCTLCHNENSGPVMPNWLQYDIVVLKKDALLDRLFVKMDMPMQGMPAPTDSEKELIHQWILKGLKYENK